MECFVRMSEGWLLLLLRGQQQRGRPSIQTALVDSTLSLVSGEVSRLYQGGEDPSPFTLLSEGDEEEEEEEFR